MSASASANVLMTILIHSGQIRKVGGASTDTSCLPMDHQTSVTKSMFKAEWTAMEHGVCHAIFMRSSLSGDGSCRGGNSLVRWNSQYHPNEFKSHIQRACQIYMLTVTLTAHARTWKRSRRVKASGRQGTNDRHPHPYEKVTTFVEHNSDFLQNALMGYATVCNVEHKINSGKRLCSSCTTLLHYMIKVMTWDCSRISTHCWRIKCFMTLLAISRLTGVSTPT